MRMYAYDKADMSEFIESESVFMPLVALSDRSIVLLKSFFFFHKKAS